MFTGRSVLILLCSFVPAASTGCGRFVVDVDDANTGVPVANATVTITEGTNSVTVTTNGAGTATFNNGGSSNISFPGGDNTISVTAVGYNPTTIVVKDISTADINQGTVIRVHLTKAAPPSLVDVEFHTSASLSAGAVGQGGIAVTVTVTPGSLSVTTQPVQGQNYDAGTIPGLQTGTLYQYSAAFPNGTVTGSFTPTGPSPYVVPIVFNQSATSGGTSGVKALPSKVLP